MYTFKICKVLSIDDESDYDLIKVRFEPEDDIYSSLSDIPYCFPLLPKMFYVKPKVGEAVLVFTIQTGNAQSQRFYIGPIISQLNKINFDKYDTAVSFTKGGILEKGKAPSLNPNTKGAFNKDDSIAIRGRGDCDIEITNNDIRLRSGVKVSNDGISEGFGNRNTIDDVPIFNKQGPAYLKLKQYKNRDDYKSTATIVADKINLITHNIGNYQLTDRDELISDDEMDKIINEAHQLPYGDILVKFLRKLKTALVTHVHPFPGCIPIKGAAMTDVESFPIDTILCKNIRIE